MRENFKSMFNTTATPKAAYVLFNHWFNNAIGQDITAITKVANMFSEPVDRVIFSLVSKFNNAMAQRLNGKIQILKTMGRGYFNF